MVNAIAGLDLRPWIRPGDTVMWGQANTEPLTLTRALVAQRRALAPLRLFLGIGASDTLRPEHADSFRFMAYGAGGTNRLLADDGLLDVLPVHYSTMAQLIANGDLRIDVLLLQVSPPDALGRHSMGMAAEYLVGAIDRARVVIAEVNPQVPWVTCERYLAAADVDLLVPASHAPIDMPAATLGPVELAIAAHVAALVEDGATLQLGIGGVPDAVLIALHGHRDLGLHSGAAGEGVAALAEAGVLTNARKTIDTGVSVAGVLIGRERLRRWADHNASLRLCSTAYTHDPAVLERIDRLVAINSALEVDLTGQIGAEVANGVYIGAVGGAADFLRAAARSRGGLPIVALPSTARGASRIVARLAGAVSTARSDAGLIVTEHGVADLRGQPLSERVHRMIAIAPPDAREELARAAHDQLRRAGAASSS